MTARDDAEVVEAVARTIWETSRADEGTISATGANIIARALLPFIREREAAAWERGLVHGETCRGGLTCDPRTANPYRAALTDGGGDE